MTETFSDVPSDLIVSVDGVELSLHKFPLMSRSGKIRRLLGEKVPKEPSYLSPVLEFTGFPGGADIFELAAKFCYGINFEITSKNVAHLRCAAEMLEMRDKFDSDNLVARTEAYLNEVVFKNIESSAEVLHCCEQILSLAEEVKIVNRCIDAVAFNASSEHQKLYTLMKMDKNNSGLRNAGAGEHVYVTESKATIEWWADCLLSLRIDLYQRVFAALKARGLKAESLGGSLMQYAHHALKSFVVPSAKEIGIFPETEVRTKAKMLADMKPMRWGHKQRVMLELLVSLLPSEKNLFPTSFLLSLLQSAIYLDTTAACRLDLEHRIGFQLEHATVDDLLISTSSNARSTTYDIDMVQRILATYLQQKQQKAGKQHSFLSSTPINIFEDGYANPPKGMTEVAKIVDKYLAEVASDPNLQASKFTSLMKQLPSHARVLDDGLYRAIDIFLEVVHH